MTPTKLAYGLSAFSLLFAGGFLAPDETIAYLLILLGCVAGVLYAMEP